MHLEVDVVFEATTVDATSGHYLNQRVLEFHFMSRGVRIAMFNETLPCYKWTGSVFTGHEMAVSPS